MTQTQLLNNLNSNATPPLGLANVPSAVANQFAEILNLPNATQTQLALIEGVVVGSITLGFAYTVYQFFCWRNSLTTNLTPSNNEPTQPLTPSNNEPTLLTNNGSDLKKN